MKTSKNGIELIKQFEGLRLNSYQCSAGKWTIGYGHCSKDVKPGMTINKVQAEEMLVHDLEIYEKAVNRNIKVELNQNQFDALVSWTYNLGETNLRNSTLLKTLNSGDFSDVEFQIKRWNKCAGRILPGLVHRRELEAFLFNTPCEIEYENTGAARAKPGL